MLNRLATANLYGSARLGAQHPEALVYPRLPNQNPADLSAGSKRYELTNHLGNVLSTVSDLLTPVDTDNNNTTDHFAAIVHNQQAYYPFGMLMPGLQYTPPGERNSRYGFNGKENDDEVAGVGKWQDYGERMYSPQIGRFPSSDPLFKKFPMLSTYQFGSLNPIGNIDLDGLEGVPSISYEIFKALGITTTTATQVENDVKKGLVKAGRLSQDALIVTGGVLTIWVSGGTALPFVAGAVASVGGAWKFYFDAKGDYTESDAIPTSISGTVMVTANYMVGEEVFSQSFQSTVSFVEGVATLDLKKLKVPNFTENANETVSLLNLTIDATNLPADIQNMLVPNNFHSSPQEKPNTCPADKSNVVMPQPIPELKKGKETKAEKKSPKKTGNKQ